MSKSRSTYLKFVTTIMPAILPFSDSGTDELPLGRLLRLSLFQVSVGLAMVLLAGTLNRVMIVEMGVPAWLVSIMIALPLVAAPFRALIGYKSDQFKSFLGFRRVPFIWLGTMLQFAGLAIMPFALLVLSEPHNSPPMVGELVAGLAFLLVGAGLHTTQTAGIALATDLARDDMRPRIVALLYVMLLIGMMVSAVVLGALLSNYNPVILIQVIQGCAIFTITLNLIALWKQEKQNLELTAPDRERPAFSETWNAYKGDRRAMRLLVAVGLGTAAFSMQDILLEPYGAEILKLGVGATTALTAMLAGGSLIGFIMAARLIEKGGDPIRMSAIGTIAGIIAFSAIIIAGALESAMLFRSGVLMIGFGGGLFAVATLTSAMARARSANSGLELGAWGAVQATAAGAAILVGGIIRDVVNVYAMDGTLGVALQNPVTGYGVVYHIEIALLFATLIALGPLCQVRRSKDKSEFRGLAELPGS